jgi:site-specific DNA-methyltransferase (adenine-specific)
LSKKYDIILTDNPYQYNDKQQNDPKRGGITYPTLTMEELYNLDISRIAADNSILFSWVMMPKLVDQYYEKYDPISIIRAWGFRPITIGFVWVKINSKGQTVTDDTVLLDYDDWYSGLGRYSNSNVECVIIGRRGKMLPREERNVKQLIFAPIGKHSEKPKEQYDRYDRLFGIQKHNYRCIELFARKQNAPPNGWKATGLDYDGIDIRDFLKGYA